MPTRILDAIDRNILNALQDNGRLSNVELANKVGLSPSACLRRVQALEGQGFISGYAARLAPKKLGLGVTAFIQVQFAQNEDTNTDSFKQAMANMENVLACYAVNGSFDYLLKVVATDLEAYEEFVMRKLLKTPGVKEVRSAFVLESVKDTVSLPLSAVTDDA